MLEEEWVTVAEAAQIIGCHKMMIHRYARQGLIKRKKIPKDGKRQTYSVFAIDDVIVIAGKRLKKHGKKGRYPEINPVVKDENVVVKPKGYRHKKKETIEAICPRCRCKHQSSRRWTGKGTPYFFCEACARREIITSPYRNTATPF